MQENEKWNVKVTVIPFIIGVLETIPKGLLKRQEDLEISWDHPDYHIINIDKIREEFWRLE